jgi:[ribosomal protein S18]-alanine N-acetyltransferase
MSYMFTIIINKAKTIEEVNECAHFMCHSEPWITLKRDYTQSFATLKDTSKELYLAMSDKNFAGFLLLQMTGSFKGYIQSLFVHPEMRRKGIGSSLLQFGENRIFRETPNVFICVSSFNSIAQEFYLNKGYEIVGELTNYIVNGHSEILLRKTIGCLSDFKREKR